MMEKYLNDETIAEITRLSALLFTPREIAVMQEITPVEDFIDFCTTEGNRFYTAFQSGRLQTEVDLRNSIIKLAKSGSSPAQTMAMDILNKSRIKMIDR